MSGNAFLYDLTLPSDRNISRSFSVSRGIFSFMSRAEPILPNSVSCPFSVSSVVRKEITPIHLTKYGVIGNLVFGSRQPIWTLGRSGRGATGWLATFLAQYLRHIRERGQDLRNGEQRRFGRLICPVLQFNKNLSNLRLTPDCIFS